MYVAHCNAATMYIAKRRNVNRMQFSHSSPSDVFILVNLSGKDYVSENAIPVGEKGTIKCVMYCHLWQEFNTYPLTKGKVQNRKK